MRDRFPLVMIGGLLIVGVLASFVLRGARRGDFADELSTYRSTKDGSRAMYLLLEQAKLPTKRVQKSLEIIDPETNLVLLAPTFASERTRRSSFFSADGGLDDDDDDADLTDDEKEERKRRGMNALRAPGLSKEETEKILETVRNGATALVLFRGHRENPLTKALGITLTEVDKNAAKEVRTLVPAQPSPYTLGVEHAEAKVQAYLDLPASGVPLLLDDGVKEPVMAMVPWGQGRFIVMTTPELAANQALTRGDNAQLWLSTGRALAKTGTIGFDEFHHGFTGDRSMGDFLARYGAQYAVAQALLGLMVWAASLKRFGRAKVPTEELRIGSTDALFATSRLYREGGHHVHAAQAIVKEVSAELSAKAGVSARASPGDVSAALAMRQHAELAQQLLAITRAAAMAHTEDGVLQVARMSAQLRQTLHKPRKRTNP